eukprot:5684399-Amphidinium_carterae.1
MRGSVSPLLGLLRSVLTKIIRVILDFQEVVRQGLDLGTVFRSVVQGEPRGTTRWFNLTRRTWTEDGHSGLAYWNDIVDRTQSIHSSWSRLSSTELSAPINYTKLAECLIQHVLSTTEIQQAWIK